MSYISDLPTSAVRLATGSDAPRWGLQFGMDGGFEASDRWYVPFADVDGDGLSDVYRFVNVVAGATETISMGAFGTVYIPLRYPLPNILMLADGVRVEQVGWDTSATNPETGAATGYYTGAYITVEYKTPRHPVSGSDAMVTVQSEPATFPMLTSIGGVVRAHEVGGRREHVTIHNVSSTSFNPDTWAGTSYMGLINSNTPWRGAGQYYRKFSGLGYVQTRRWDGVTTYDVSFPLELRAIPWNREYNAAGSLATHTLYTGSDLASLLGI